MWNLRRSRGSTGSTPGGPEPNTPTPIRNEPVTPFFRASTSTSTPRNQSLKESVVGSSSSPLSGRGTDRLPDQSMKQILLTIEKHHSQSGLSAFLNSLVQMKDQHTRQKMGKWLKTTGPEAWVSAWSGADRWAVDRVKAMMRKETKAAGNATNLKVRAKKLRDPKAISFDIREMYSEMQEFLPTTVELLEAIMVHPPPTPMPNKKKAQITITMEPEEPSTPLRSRAPNAASLDHPSSPISSAISAVEGFVDAVVNASRVGRIGDWLAGTGSDHSDEESVKSLESEDGYEWVDLIDRSRALRRENEERRPEDTVKVVRRRKDDKLVSTHTSRSANNPLTDKVDRRHRVVKPSLRFQTVPQQNPAGRRHVALRSKGSSSSNYDRCPYGSFGLVLHCPPGSQYACATMSSQPPQAVQPISV